uniref:Cytoskeleton-associated protein 5 n=1 Tax=Lygus hesperus TaxID=30085 RepID=A0A0A9Z0U4_LYGHE
MIHGAGGAITLEPYLVEDIDPPQMNHPALDGGGGSTGTRQKKNGGSSVRVTFPTTAVVGGGGVGSKKLKDTASSGNCVQTVEKQYQAYVSRLVPLTSREDDTDMFAKASDGRNTCSAGKNAAGMTV